jgi:hypothetical protein
MPIVVTHIAAGQGSTVASYTMSVTATVPAGSLICVFIYDNGGMPNAGSVTDTAGNTYTRILPYLSTAMFYAWNCLQLVNGNKITYTKRDSSNGSVADSLYATGVMKTADPHDAAVDATHTLATGTTTPTVTSGVPSVAGELFIAGLGWGNYGVAGVTQDTTNGWATPFVEVNAYSIEVFGGNQVNAAMTAKIFTPTVNGMNPAGGYAAVVTAFKPSPSLVSGGNMPMLGM